MEAVPWTGSEFEQETWSVTLNLFAWDKVNSSTQVFQPLRFPGQYFDEETQAWGKRYSFSNTLYIQRPALHDNRYRVYDPFMGGYMQVDPLVDSTWEAYSYAGQNPVMNVDPTGLCPGCTGPETPGDDAPSGDGWGLGLGGLDNFWGSGFDFGGWGDGKDGGFGDSRLGFNLWAIDHPGGGGGLKPPDVPFVQTLDDCRQWVVSARKWCGQCKERKPPGAGGLFQTPYNTKVPRPGERYLAGDEVVLDCPNSTIARNCNYSRGQVLECVGHFGEAAVFSPAAYKLPLPGAN